VTEDPQQVIGSLPSLLPIVNVEGAGENLVQRLHTSRGDPGGQMVHCPMRFINIAGITAHMVAREIFF
jgi:hypothetical protein